MNRADFLRMSAAALAGLSVEQLTDRHDEWLFDRDFADGSYTPIRVAMLGERDSLVAFQDLDCTISPSCISLASHVEHLLYYEHESTAPVSVCRVVARWVRLGEVLESTIPVPYLRIHQPLVLLKGDSATLLPPADGILARISYDG